MLGSSSTHSDYARRHPCQSCEGWAGCGCDETARGLPLEPGFFTAPPVRQALARYDFGFVFRAVRRATGLTQHELGQLVGLDQDRISRIERSERPLRDIALIVRVATVLGIPAVLLGFDPGGATVDATGGGQARDEVDWVRRRDFSWVVAGIVLGVGAEVVDLDRLQSMLSTGPAAPTLTRAGLADVEAIEQATALFRRQDFTRGGGACRPAAVALFLSVLAYRRATCSAAVRERLLIATADLGMVAAWTCYDAERHNDARRLWMSALRLAREAEHPRTADLAADLLLDMTHQALHLRRPRKALDLVQLAFGAAASCAHPVSASTASYLASHQAWCYAASADAGACARALAQAVEKFTAADPATAAPWAAHIDAAELAALQGHVHFTLAMSTTEPRHATRAVPFLRQAVDSYGPGYARSRAVNLAGLAGAHALTGDLDAATQVGHRAVEEISALASPRAYDRLRTLDAVLRRYGTHPDVSQLRAGIHAAVA